MTPSVFFRILLLPALLRPVAASAQPQVGGGQPTLATDSASPLPRLLAERRALTQQYAAASQQRHALLGLTGKPSKKDLQAVVDALQGIVNKDEQIVAALNQTTRQAQTTAATLQTTATTLQNTSRDDRNHSAERFAELQNELLNAQQRQRQAAAREQALTADLTEAQQSRTVRDALIAALALSSLGLLLWRRRRR